MDHPNTFETTLEIIEARIKAAGALLAGFLVASGGACYLSAALMVF